MIRCHSMGLIIIITTVIMIITAPSIQAQSSKRSARIFYQKDMLAEAHPFFVQSVQNGEKSCSWLIKATEACLEVNDVVHALEYAQIVVHKKGRKKPHAIRLLAISLHRNEEYEKAIDTYKQYLKHTSHKDEYRQRVKYKILQCRNGIKYSRIKNDRDIVENIGISINNDKNQFGLIQSSLSDNRYYFSSENELNTGGKRNLSGVIDEKYGVYKTDMFRIIRDQGVWSSIHPANPILNTPLHDILLSLDDEGKALIYFKGLTKDQGHIYIDSFDINHLKSIENKELSKNSHWRFSGDKGLFLFRDSILFFSSNMAGGYGGYDIYMSIHHEGEWQEPVNLGPQLNSPFDEVTPYMSNNGRSFYFSSNSTKSIGGQDIFRIEFDAVDQSWKYLKNVGIPINSTGDDTHYRGSNDGYQGSLTSNRKEGYGQSDIYLIYYNRLQKNELTVRDPDVYASLYNKLKNNQRLLDKVDDFKYRNQTQKKEVLQPDRLSMETITDTHKDFISDKHNIIYLNKIITILKAHPATKIKISGHIAGEGKEYGLIFGSKERADQVRQYFLTHGIDTTQIITIGYGNAYPLVNSSNNHGSFFNIINKMNNRLEFTILNEEPNLILSYRLLDVPLDLRTNKDGSLKGLNYKIRLKQSNQVLAHPLISGANKAILRQEGGAKNSYYYISNFKNYNNAKNGLQLLNSRQFQNCIVVAFIGDEIINRQQIMDYSLSFPDLTLYLKDYP